MASFSLVRVSQKRAALMVPQVRKSIKMTPFTNQTSVSLTFPAEGDTLNFFVTDELGCFHVFGEDLVSGVKLYTHVSSPVMILKRKGKMKRCGRL
ncbi:hypothetical protein AVEN_138018-1 [Araneus ventricosus]|uniref:Uncharacterized protein n=1 Tax=Araneus ventricosus TaxID=182803 RepID=A0A4Y2LCW8_ARAVE|nr:hypothetical protein AVEN_138018-1 [Araneus ventricosus]